MVDGILLMVNSRLRVSESDHLCEPKLFKAFQSTNYTSESTVSEIQKAEANCANIDVKNKDIISLEIGNVVESEHNDCVNSAHSQLIDPITRQFDPKTPYTNINSHSWDEFEKMFGKRSDFFWNHP